MILTKTATFLEMIKISHTVFALPFAIGAAFVAADGVPRLPVIGKIVLAVLCLRTAAMAFNRLVDQRIDAANPRTADRALPAGDLSRPFVIVSVVIALAGFFATSAWINELAFRLSPIAVVVALGYSLTKRFTALCHFVLGLALGLAPVGAWVAVRGTLDPAPWWLGLAVLLWTAGFDILYACMDADFDREQGLHSIPSRLNLRGALRVAASLHAAMLVALIVFGRAAGLGWIFGATLVGVGLLLAYEHRLVRPDDLGRVNHAFFTLNGVISVVLMSALIASVFLG